MTVERSSKDFRGRKLKRHLAWWVTGMGAVAAAVLLAGLALGGSTAQAQVPDATYEGDIEGGGTISFAVEECFDDTCGISQLKVTGLVTYCFVIDLDVSQPELIGAIADGQLSLFVDAATFDLGVTGVFPSETEFTGHLDVFDDALDPDCADLDIPITASLVSPAAPTADAPTLPTTGAVLEADGGLSVGLRAMIGALLVAAAAGLALYSRRSVRS